MGFAVFHAEKMSASGAGLGDHIDRKEGQEHSFQNADPSRRHLNQSFAVTEHCAKPLPSAISDRIAEGYTGTSAIRKDAVRALSLVFTGTHEDMKALEADPGKMEAWLQANYRFVAQEFGRENVVRLALHLDEKTPHLHAVVVPLAEGKLTAKKILGNKIDMSRRQDRYAQAMEPFGLSRGVRGSKAVHNSEGWYLGQQKQAQEATLGDLPKLTALDRLSPARYEEKVQEGFKAVSRAKTDLETELRRREQQLKHAQEGQRKAEAKADRHKEATLDLAEQLIQAGKEGVRLDSSYALFRGPAALREAATALLYREVGKLADRVLQPIAETLCRAFYKIEQGAEPSPESYRELQRLDTPESHRTLANGAVELLNQEALRRWGARVPAGSKPAGELQQKALRFIQEASRSIGQEVRKALGLDEPRQQSRGRGIGR